ncbi:XRE family transcriptional regulator [Escherichia coli]|uniref:YhhA family cyclophane-containing RiPP n=1 Tax=Escherichia coli TaxID=562 RepID=UPI00193AB6E0|nr:YhhA family cyclophane-containing RiPP [Escherichia coli]MCA7799191.1 XRE family transcriptional regulator [Escherichia coli]
MMQKQTEEAKRILKTDGYSGSNPVLSRLMEEVRNEKNTTVGSRYDRVHNRHNR